MSEATTDEIAFPETPFPLQDALILLGRRGSEAYDLVTSTGSGDEDLMGVVIPTARYYLGLSQWEVAEEIVGRWDTVLYELKKFVLLLMKQNPNVLGLLWTDDEHILHRTIEGTTLIENRGLFRHSDYARHAFAGYAQGQLHRMTSFNRAAMQKIVDLEQRLQEHDIHLGHAAEGKLWDPRPEVLALLKRYVDLRRTHRKAYMGAKRWELVQKVGYDAKNSGHMVRLLHQGYEYLTEGVIHVRRTWDREMLMQIKRGEWPLDHVKKHAATWFDKIETAKSVLPESIDEAQVEGLVMSLIRRRLDLKEG